MIYQAIFKYALRKYRKRYDIVVAHELAENLAFGLTAMIYLVVFMGSMVYIYFEMSNQ